MRVAALVLLLLASCSTGPVGADAYWHSHQKPVTVALHEDLREACKESTLAAVEFWRARCGVDFLRTREVGRGWHGWQGEAPPAGYITVRDGTLALGELGSTEPRHIARRMRWARTRLALDSKAACDLETVAHELGHGLGLNDRYGDEDQDKLMFWQSEDQLLVTDAECAWVRQ